MFARGNWSVFGIDRQLAGTFRQTLDNRETMLRWSQATASAVVRTTHVPAIGINPYDRPRLDEDHVVAVELMERLTRARVDDLDGWWAEELEQLFAYGETRYRIDENRYGFWFVFSDWRDVSDVASIREDLAYRNHGLPYRLLDKHGRKAIEEKFQGQTTVMRKQFPVIVDFNQGMIFAESTSKSHLGLLASLFHLLGTDSFPMCWRFLPEGDWIRPVLAQLYQESRFKEAFEQRAEERTRLPVALIEKSENLELEKILAANFSMTELETEEWIGLGTPAEIKLYPSADRVVATTPTNALMLLNAAEEAIVESAQLLFQERIVSANKKGEERTFRRDLFRMALSNGINDLDAGVALLRGFDLPGFRRDVARERRRSKGTPAISLLWLNWLRGMEDAIRMFSQACVGLLDKQENLREELARQLDRGEYGIVPLSQEQFTGNQTPGAGGRCAGHRCTGGCKTWIGTDYGGAAKR